MDLVILLFSVVVILFLASALKKNKQGSSKNFPPGPPPLPIIGNMHIVDGNKPYRTFMQLSKEYGQVFSIKLGPSKSIVLSGYDTIKDAFTNHAEILTTKPHIPIFSFFTQDIGVVFSNGDNWKAMRRFTLSTLRDYGMGKKTIQDKIIEESEFLTQKIRLYEGKPCDNQAIFKAAVTNIIVTILLNKRYDYEDPTILRLLAIVTENTKLLNSPWVMLYNSYPFLFKWLPGPHRTMSENMKELKSFVRKTFRKQRKELDVNDQRNLVDTFLAKQQEGNPESTQYYHNDNLTGLMVDMFSAGVESTATTLRWAILLMMKYPEIQKKVQNEIERVIGSACPQMEHRKQMPYTDAVIHEILRFADLSPITFRSVTEDFTFRGYFIPEGTTVITLLHSALRDKAFFEKPDEFYPEHFLDSNGKLTKKDAFIPFSLGKRSCIGKSLAEMELFIFFTSLLQNFIFHSPPGAELDLTPGLGFTNGPKPYTMCAVPRR
ncbi:cytochrome P450 2K6-like [Bufo bufo]|uniref:cytochrome P450 2K6-like n=1 Tax=Bufo bufo TaxID=8384 RepID=UPI001ABDB0BF|nr:cytochrome P450 2K6-like [Bufo bufo]